MACSGHFQSCMTKEAVHIELLKQLSCDYLHETACTDSFTRFKYNCRLYINTPAFRALTRPSDILDSLETKTDSSTGKPLLSPGNYSVLRVIVKDIHADILDIIDDAETRIASLSASKARGQHQSSDQGIVATKRPKLVAIPEDTDTTPDSNTKPVSYQTEIKRKKVKKKSKQQKTPRVQRHYKEDVPLKEIENLRKVMYEQNFNATQIVPVSPLQKSAKDLPVDLLYAPVFITENLEVSSINNKMDKTGGQVGSDRNAENNPEDVSDSEQKCRQINGPGDIFYKHGKPVRYVFLRGEAGRGKSSFCLRMTHYWCTAKNHERDKNNLTDWEQGLNDFEFLFRVVLRQVNIERSELIDMICNDVFRHNPECRDAICHVLSSNRYRCLVIIDGLDEWKKSPEASSRLTDDCLPNIDGISETTYFFTSRPWKFEEVGLSVRKDVKTRIIEMYGLDEIGIKRVIENVLIHFYELKRESPEFKKKRMDMIEKSKRTNLKSLMEIPLLVTASVQLWYEGNEVGNNMTSFYIDLVRLLIKRTYNTRSSYEAILNTLNQKRASDPFVPEVIKKNKTFRDFIHVLCALGKIASDDLLSQETNLVLQKDELDDKLDKSVIEFALNVGLLSQTEAAGSFGTENVLIDFFHKTIQEFLAAVNIACWNKGNIESFLGHIYSIKQVMDLSNVIMFISGLFPSLGSIISHHIVRLADKDEDICKYRDTFDDHLQEKVKLLFEIQVGCYKEITIRRNSSVSTPESQVQDVSFHVADVFVDKYKSSKTTTQVTCELLRDPNVNITSVYYSGKYDCKLYLPLVKNALRTLKSLHLAFVTLCPDALQSLQKALQNNKVLESLTLDTIVYKPVAERKIPAPLSDVLRVIPHSLTTLFIRDLCSKTEIMALVETLPKLQHLRNVEYWGVKYIGTYPNAEDDAAVAKTLSCVKHLQRLQLHHVSLEDVSLELTSEMSAIEKIVLEHVYMSAENWNKFLNSIINISHCFQVTLRHTDLDDKSRNMIHSSSCFSVTSYKRPRKISDSSSCFTLPGNEDSPWLQFTRVSLSRSFSCDVGVRQNFTTADNTMPNTCFREADIGLDNIFSETLCPSNNSNTLLSYSGKNDRNLYLSKLDKQIHMTESLHLYFVTLSPEALHDLLNAMDNNKVLKSLRLDTVTYKPEDSRMIPAPLSDVLSFLPNSLTTLFIRDLSSKTEIMALVNALPHLRHLTSVEYWGVKYIGTYPNAEDDAAVARTLFCMKQLRSIRMCHVTMDDVLLELTSEMSHLEKDNGRSRLEFTRVAPSAQGTDKRYDE